MDNFDLLTCPICHSPLTHTHNSLTCSRRHTFDIAREGYINLLRKQLPGDTREMLQARRAFFDRDHYRPLSDTINELITAHLPPFHPSTPPALSDPAAAEAYYLARHQQS